MKAFFADTSYFVAALDPDDEFHEAARRFSQTNRRPFITTSAVIAELGAYFSPVSGRQLFVDIITTLRRGKIEVIYVDGALQDRAIKLFAARPDKNWSLDDCISFIAMGDRGLKDAATTDEHFEQAGFVALLRAAGGKS